MRVLTQRAHSSWKTRHGRYLDEHGLWRWNSSEEAALGSQSDADTDAQEKMRQNRAGAGAVTGLISSPIPNPFYLASNYAPTMRHPRLDPSFLLSVSASGHALTAQMIVLMAEWREGCNSDRHVVHMSIPG